jgi:hypothetical protein
MSNIPIPLSIPPTDSQNISASTIARELWWTSQEFSPADIIIIITMALYAYVSPGR